MYIVAIAWIYVVLLMSLTETSAIAGIATFVFYGLAPLALLVWLMGTPQRRRNRRRTQAEPGSVAGSSTVPDLADQTSSRSQMTAAIRPQAPSRR